MIEMTKLLKLWLEGETVKFKNFARKIKSPFMIYVIQYQKMESNLVPKMQNPMRLTRINIKTMLLAVMVINQKVLMISLVF